MFYDFRSNLPLPPKVIIKERQAQCDGEEVEKVVVAAEDDRQLQQNLHPSRQTFHPNGGHQHRQCERNLDNKHHQCQ
jgi:hypothetical protein